MLDLKRTLKLISGGLLNPQQTWQEYLPDAGDWQKTALLLTVPLIVVAATGAYLLGLLGSDVSIMGRFRPTLVATLLTMVSSLVAAAVIALVFSVFAGVFGGKNNFAKGLAATTFAFIPGYIGQATMWLPWVGTLVSLGLFIYGMVLLWKVIPVYLDVPDGRRTGHYILSLLACIVAMFILSATLGRFLIPSMGAPAFSDFSRSNTPNSSSSPTVFGGLVRQGELMAAAEEDRYDPPGNGRLTKKQVAEFARVMARTEELQERKMQDLKQLAEKAEKNNSLYKAG